MSGHLGRIFLILVLALLLGIVIRHDPGYVLVSWGKTSVEMSLVLAAVLWLGSLWLVVQLAAFERWLVRVWRSDKSRFWGLGQSRQAGAGPAAAVTGEKASRSVDKA